MKKPKKIESIKDLVPDDLNANRGSVRGRAMLEDSLQNYGAGRSVLADRNGKLIAGNKTAEAAVEIGFEKVIVVPTDGKTLVVVQRTDLDLDTDKSARELALLDNRTSEVNLTWDAAALQQLESAGVNVSIAFDEAEFAQIIHDSEDAAALALQAEPPLEFPAYDENLETDYRCPKCAYVWSGKPR